MNIAAPVSKIMTKTLITVSPITTLDKVKKIFDTHNFHHVPVVEDGYLLGIISKVDLYRVSHCIDLFNSKSNMEYNERLFKSLLAQEVMSPNTTILSPNDTISYAAKLFNLNQFHALPVIVDEKLVGMVTTYDMIRFAYESQPYLVG